MLEKTAGYDTDWVCLCARVHQTLSLPAMTRPMPHRLRRVSASVRFCLTRTAICDPRQIFDTLRLLFCSASALLRDVTRDEASRHDFALGV